LQPESCNALSLQAVKGGAAFIPPTALDQQQAEGVQKGLAAESAQGPPSGPLSGTLQQSGDALCSVLPTAVLPEGTCSEAQQSADPQLPLSPQAVALLATAVQELPRQDQHASPDRLKAHPVAQQQVLVQDQHQQPVQEQQEQQQQQMPCTVLYQDTCVLGTEVLAAEPQPAAAAAAAAATGHTEQQLQQLPPDLLETQVLGLTQGVADQQQGRLQPSAPGLACLQGHQGQQLPPELLLTEPDGLQHELPATLTSPPAREQQHDSGHPAECRQGICAQQEVVTPSLRPAVTDQGNAPSPAGAAAVHVSSPAVVAAGTLAAATTPAAGVVAAAAAAATPNTIGDSEGLEATEPDLGGTTPRSATPAATVGAAATAGGPADLPETEAVAAAAAKLAAHPGSNAGVYGIASPGAHTAAAAVSKGLKQAAAGAAGGGAAAAAVPGDACTDPLQAAKAGPAGLSAAAAEAPTDMFAATQSTVVEAPKQHGDVAAAAAGDLETQQAGADEPCLMAIDEAPQHNSSNRPADGSHSGVPGQAHGQSEQQHADSSLQQLQQQQDHGSTGDQQERVPLLQQHHHQQQQAVSTVSRSSTLPSVPSTISSMSTSRCHSSPAASNKHNSSSSPTGVNSHPAASDAIAAADAGHPADLSKAQGPAVPAAAPAAGGDGGAAAVGAAADPDASGDPASAAAAAAGSEPVTAGGTQSPGVKASQSCSVVTQANTTMQGGTTQGTTTQTTTQVSQWLTESQEKVQQLVDRANEGEGASQATWTAFTV